MIDIDEVRYRAVHDARKDFDLFVENCSDDELITKFVDFRNEYHEWMQADDLEEDVARKYANIHYVSRFMDLLAGEIAARLISKLGYDLDENGYLVLKSDT